MASPPGNPPFFHFSKTFDKNSLTWINFSQPLIIDDLRPVEIRMKQIFQSQTLKAAQNDVLEVRLFSS